MNQEGNIKYRQLMFKYVDLQVKTNKRKKYFEWNWIKKKHIVATQNDNEKVVEAEQTKHVTVRELCENMKLWEASNKVK